MLASAHAGTARISHCETQSRPFLEIAANGMETIEHRLDWDIEGQVRSRADAYGRTALQTGYDMAGRKLSVIAMDAGLRLTFPDVAGRTLFRWDASTRPVRAAFGDWLVSRTMTGWRDRKRRVSRLCVTGGHCRRWTERSSAAAATAWKRSKRS